MKKEHILSYLSEIKNELLQSGIEKIGLFGSFAKNTAKPYSDIDIAIRIDKSFLETHDVWEYFTLIEKIKTMLLQKFSRKVDIYDLDSINDINKSIQEDIIYV